MGYDDDELERMRARREQRRNGGAGSGSGQRRGGGSSPGTGSRRGRGSSSEADDYDTRRSLGDSGSRQRSGGDTFRSGYSGPRNGSGKGMKQQRVSGRRRRPDRRKRIMIIAAEIAVLVVLVAGAGLWYLYQRTFGSMGDIEFDKANVTNLNLTDEQLEGMKGYMTIACFGVDSRNEHGKMNVGKGTNADVNMICSVDLETGEIKLVSVFRDTYLNISDKNSYNKINAAYAQGGPEQAVKALNKNLGLNITQYATFNWKAVADAINILDGVDIEISDAEFSWINAYITETVNETGIPSTPLAHAGEVHLDGVQAVAYGRLRLGDTDYARTERQRIILNKAFEKAKSASWADLNNILQTVTPQLATNITIPDLIPLARNISKYHMGDTSGFPSARGEGTVGKLGDCVIPKTLESNVKSLHSFLFGVEDFQVPSNVREYSNKIAEVTGMTTAGKEIGHVPVDQGLNARSYVNRKIKKQEEKAAEELAARTTAESGTEESTDETDESSTEESSTEESSTGDGYEGDWGDDSVGGDENWDDDDWDNSGWNYGPGGSGPGSGPGSQTKPSVSAKPTQSVKPGEKPTADPDSSATGPGMTKTPEETKKAGSSSGKPEESKAPGTTEAENSSKNSSDKTNNSTKTTDSVEEAPAGPSGPGA